MFTPALARCSLSSPSNVTRMACHSPALVGDDERTDLACRKHTTGCQSLERAYRVMEWERGGVCDVLGAGSRARLTNRGEAGSARDLSVPQSHVGYQS